jgi:hypothetical protein
MNDTDEADLRPEYDLTKLGPAVRGKYHVQSRDSTNVVVIDADLCESFPNGRAVNDALRELLERRRSAT